MQSGALIEPNDTNYGAIFWLAVVREAKPGSRFLFNLSAQRIAIRRDFLAVAAQKVVSNVNGVDQSPCGDEINENPSSIVRWNLVGQQRSILRRNF
jgi:hypothetical protein